MLAARGSIVNVVPIDLARTRNDAIPLGPRSPSSAAVVVPNWNGAAFLAQCIESLLAQSMPAQIIVVDNGSSDASLAIVARYPSVEVVQHAENRGFAGGVNAGFRAALERGCDYVAAFNSDAIADPQWLGQLATTLDRESGVGITTCKLLNADGTRIDSTGDCYTSWGLPYPRGRHESELNKYDDGRSCEVFGASGGASLYRGSMLRQIGLFDEVFFAYFEDVDLSFRAQLNGWKVRYVADAMVFHQISATSRRITGFATHQYCRNVPQVLVKNVPRRLLVHVGLRFLLGYSVFLLWAVRKGEARAAIRGVAAGARLMFGSLRERRGIQAGKIVSDNYIWEIMVHGLPPRARALHKLRSAWWRLSSRPAPRRGVAPVR